MHILNLIDLVPWAYLFANQGDHISVQGVKYVNKKNHNQHMIFFAGKTHLLVKKTEDSPLSPIH